MKKNSKNNDRFKRIRKYLSRYRRYLILGGLSVLCANILNLINPYILKLAFDKLESGVEPSALLNYALLIVTFAIISGFFRFAMRRTIIWMSRKIEFDLRNDFFSHLLKLDPTFYHNAKTGDIMAHATNDVEAVRMMVGPAIMHIGNAIVSTIVAISFMFYLSPKLTMYSLLPLPILSIVVNRLGGAVHKRFLKIQEYFAVLTSRVQENLSGVRVIRAYHQEQAEIDDFAKHNRKYIDLNVSMIKVFGFMFPLLTMLAGAVNMAVLYFGGREVISGTISLGTLVAFFVYLTMLVWPMVAMGWVVSLYQRGVVSLARIDKIMDTEPTVVSTPGKANEKEFTKSIEFRNLNFAYNGTKILHNINLTIESGQTLGIIGPTASGKTTLVSLLARLFPVPRNSIFIDGIDINDWDIKKVRQQIGFVPQEPFLFSDTISQNILFHLDKENPDSTQQATRAAEAAIIDKEIKMFPDGYETILGERGITLSGGQKQRVAIARAIVIDPKIIILDDATSSVDTETEHLINQRMKDELKARTAIVISHRISAVQEADLIIYLDKGAIVERGTHQELIAMTGQYDALYRAQLIEEELKRM